MSDIGVRFTNEKLIRTGIAMGILHVLAGPDHLSALAALSVGSSWRAVVLGVRWGIGHSLGRFLQAYALHDLCLQVSSQDLLSSLYSF
jgi:hypothetical protein